MTRPKQRKKTDSVGIQRAPIAAVVSISVLSGLGLSLLSIGFVEHCYRVMEFSPANISAVRQCDIIFFGPWASLASKRFYSVGRIYTSPIGETESDGR